MFGEAEAPGNAGGLLDLIGGPMAAFLGVATHMRGRLAVEHQVVGGMNRDHLALEMGRQFGDRDADIGELALDLIAIGGAFGRPVEIEQALVPGRDLDALIAVALRPARDALQRIMGGGVLRELGQKQARSFDRLHRFLPRGRVAVIATSDPNFLCAQNGTDIPVVKYKIKFPFLRF